MTDPSGTGSPVVQRNEGPSDSDPTRSGFGISQRWQPSPADLGPSLGTPNESPISQDSDVVVETGDEPAAPSSSQSDASPPEALPTSPTDTDVAPLDSDEPHKAEALTTHFRGGFERYEIGDPGRAFDSVVSRPDREFPGIPDTIVDGVTIEDGGADARLELRAASVRGLSHRHANKVRQDDYAFNTTADRKYLVAVVADGVSSGPRSHLAAGLAAGAGCAELVGMLSSTSVEDIDWLAFLQGLAEQMSAKTAATFGQAPDSPPPTMHEVAADMASTIIVGIVEVQPGDDDCHTVHIVRLGDASGWIIRPGCVWVPLGNVKNEGSTIAESATGGLPFVPAEAPPIITTQLAAGETLVLMTDGIGDPLGAGGGEVGAALAKCWAKPPPPIQFAAQIDFGRKSFDDDRTAIAVWPTGS